MREECLNAVPCERRPEDSLSLPVFPRTTGVSETELRWSGSVASPVILPGPKTAILCSIRKVEGLVAIYRSVCPSLWSFVG